MESNLKTTVLSILGLFLITFIGYAQETYTITLIQNNDGSFHFESSDNATVLNSSSLKEYTILVYEEDEVIWEGLTMNDEEFDIDEINYVRGNKIFQNDKIRGQRGNGDKKEVKAKVKKNKKNVDYTYEIVFTINGNQQSIDPKLKVGER
ncbi:hypothetical protein [Urechidicola vernalis]|uniref:Uncharacterized protein n=1 Tax=Urechidicola vernalis TaxID=3075600 RepID=A0ABU2Y308_9FLAO|nr:hypothetical protein [Urechidicola sp. P050]MDT0552206.1 hypothetical protein [Urechidicola sp. P050]